MTDTSTPGTAPRTTAAANRSHAIELWAGKILAATLSVLYLSGVIPTSGPIAEIAGMVGSVLLYFGFAVYRTKMASAATMLVLVVMLAHTAGCGASARQREINTTLVSLNAASQAFQLYDATHEQAIASTAPDRETGERQLSEWRQKRSIIESVFVAGYRAVAVAATLNDGQSLQAMENAAALVLQELTEQGVKVP